MTESQLHDRDERMGIMVYDGKMTEEEARKYCNEHPEIYGIEGKEEKQEGLFCSTRQK